MEKHQIIERLRKQGKFVNLFQEPVDKSTLTFDLTEPTSLEVSLKHRERIRHSLTILMMMKHQTKVDEEKAKAIFGMFMAEKADINARTNIFKVYWHRVDKCNKIVKKVLREHRM